MTLLPTLFWLSLAWLFYTFAGYPLLMLGLGRLRGGSPAPVDDGEFPELSVVLAAHNEEPRIVARLQNLLASDYPPARLEVVAVSDGSTDGTVRRIREFGDPRVKPVEEPRRQGKAHALNRGVAVARGELIVFCDVRQRFSPDTLRQLARPFARPDVGAVSGELTVDPAGSAAGGGVDLYWRLEKNLRLAEARWDSSIGCTGAVYAIRRALYRPIPPDTVLDDVVIPMQIALQGRRIAFVPAARAHDPQPLDPAREQVRKRRTLAGNYQMLFRHPSWLLPWRNRLWWQLLSHKYLRLAAPFFLALMFVTNAMLTGSPSYRWLFAGQCLFYALAAAGLACPGRNILPLSVPAGFVFLNWMALNGLWHHLRRRDRSGWQPAPPPGDRHP